MCVRSGDEVVTLLTLHPQADSVGSPSLAAIGSMLSSMRNCSSSEGSAYADAQRRGYEIIQPLTNEPWGVRRLLVRAPDGNVINIVSHRDE